MLWVLIRIASTLWVLIRIDILMSIHNIGWGDTNEHPQHRILWRFDKNYLSIIMEYAPYLFFWW